VNRSTTERIAPSRLHIFSVFNDTRNGWVAAGVLKHLSAKFLIRLRVAIDEGKALRIVVLTRLLAVRTTWFGVDNQRHLVHLRMREFNECNAGCQPAPQSGAQIWSVAAERSGGAALDRVKAVDTQTIQSAVEAGALQE
jgi:hypothetical protein